ncbi:MAG: Mth938-like domain-containing protein [Sandaracinobacteroides sp.]
MSGPRLEAGPTRIEGRSAGGWVVGGMIHPPALLITADSARSLGPLTLETLDAAALPGLPGIDLLLLGTGITLHRPPAGFVAGARLRGWRVEAMDSQAAARTFNVLAGEERLVAALIL